MISDRPQDLRVISEYRAKIIHDQLTEIEHLQRQLALAEIRMEELESELAEERQGRDG